MRRPSIAPILLGVALIFGPAHADDADDLAEIARLQARLHAMAPATLRVFSAEFWAGITLELRGPGLPRTTVHVNDTHLVYLTFAADSQLAGVSHQADTGRRTPGGHRDTRRTPGKDTGTRTTL